MSEWIRYEMTRKERLRDWGGIFRGLFCSLCNSQLVAYLPQQVLAPQDVFVALNVSGTETIHHARSPSKNKDLGSNPSPWYSFCARITEIQIHLDYFCDTCNSRTAIAPVPRGESRV